MNKPLLAVTLAALGLASIGLPLTPAHAANADNPYGNVDHHNDAGNDTGDTRVDKLNSNQLNQSYKGAVEPRAPSAAGAYAPPPTTTMPPPAAGTAR